MRFVKELVDCWQHGYDRGQQEAYLSRFAHYPADIDGKASGSSGISRHRQGNLRSRNRNAGLDDRR